MCTGERKSIFDQLKKCFPEAVELMSDEDKVTLGLLREKKRLHDEAGDKEALSDADLKNLRRLEEMVINGSTSEKELEAFFAKSDLVLRERQRVEAILFAHDF